MHCQRPVTEPVFGFVVVDAGMKKPPLLARAINGDDHSLPVKSFPSECDIHLPG